MQAPSSSPISAPISLPPNQLKRAFRALLALFFMWGFLTVLNDMLIPHLKEVFTLTYAEAMLVQFSFFGAYLLFSWPSSAILQRLGYKSSMVLGLLIMGLGAASFYPAATFHAFGLFLGALFMLGAGITLLQVAANPYVNALGPPEKAGSRMALSQAFNSLGTFLAPQFGAYLILGQAGEAEPKTAAAVQGPYLFLALALIGLAFFIYKQTLPNLLTNQPSKEKPQPTPDALSKHPYLILAILAIFLYVGAEVGIGSFIVNFLGQKHILSLPPGEAGKWVSVYWGLAMAGRFIGAWVLQFIPPRQVLLVCASGAAGLAILAIFSSGWVAASALLGIGLFNSIQFPTIFSLGLEGLGPYTEKGSGLLCMAIVGGAILPLIEGYLADSTGHLQYAFWIPVACYGYILWFGSLKTPKAFAIR